MRLRFPGANFNIVREAGLEMSLAREIKNQKRTTHPHSRVQALCNLIILLESRAAPKNLRKPKLPNGSLHMSNLSLRRWRSLHPLRRLSSHTTHHIGMGEGLWRPLGGLHVQCRRNRLCNAGVQRRGTARDDQRRVLVARHGAVSSGRAHKRGVVSQGWGHCGRYPKIKRLSDQLVPVGRKERKL